MPKGTQKFLKQKHIDRLVKKGSNIAFKILLFIVTLKACKYGPISSSRHCYVYLVRVYSKYSILTQLLKFECSVTSGRLLRQTGNVYLHFLTSCLTKFDTIFGYLSLNTVTKLFET